MEELPTEVLLLMLSFLNNDDDGNNQEEVWRVRLVSKRFHSLVKARRKLCPDLFPWFFSFPLFHFLSPPFSKQENKGVPLLHFGRISNKQTKNEKQDWKDEVDSTSEHAPSHTIRLELCVGRNHSCLWRRAE